MAEGDSIDLDKLASKVSVAANEAAQLAEDINNKTKDPILENIQHDFSRFADACYFLSFQLSKFDLAANTWDDRFWKSLRLVLERWLKVTQLNVRWIRQYQKQRISTWTGRFLSNPLVTRRVTKFAEDYNVVNVDARMEDAQMIIALLNLESKLKNKDSYSHLGFLSKDLEWKTEKVQTRTSRTRRQLKLPPNWGQTQDIIAEVAMATAKHAKKLSTDTGVLADIDSTSF